MIDFWSELKEILWSIPAIRPCSQGWRPMALLATRLWRDSAANDRGVIKP